MKINSALLLACVCASTLLHPRVCDAQAVQPREALQDARLYFTAPLRWDGRDWLEFGGTLVAIVTVGDQGITVYRDYWNPLAAAAAMGGLEDAVSAFDHGRSS